MVVILLVVQGSSAAALLSLNALNAVGEAQFALLLGVNLVALDMVIYVYRMMKLQDPIKTLWIAAGILMMGILMASALFVH